MSEFPVIVTAGLAKQIAESLREHILSGRIKVDERLPTEEELARQFGVSRPTIREALKRLAAENLIQSRRGPRGGSTVRHPRPEEISADLEQRPAIACESGAVQPQRHRRSAVRTGKHLLPAGRPAAEQGLSREDAGRACHTA